MTANSALLASSTPRSVRRNAPTASKRTSWISSKADLSCSQTWLLQHACWTNGMRRECRFPVVDLTFCLQPCGPGTQNANSGAAVRTFCVSLCSHASTAVGVQSVLDSVLHAGNQRVHVRVLPLSASLNCCLSRIQLLGVPGVLADAVRRRHERRRMPLPKRLLVRSVHLLSATSP